MAFQSAMAGVMLAAEIVAQPRRLAARTAAASRLT